MPAAGWAAKSGDPVLWVTRDAIPAADARGDHRAQAAADLRARAGGGGLERRCSKQLGELGDGAAHRRRRPGRQRDRLRALLRRRVRLERRRPRPRARVRSTRSGRSTPRAAAPLSASGTYGPLLLLTDGERAARAAPGLPARHPARLRQGPGARRLQPRLDDRRRERDLGRRAGADRRAARDPARATAATARRLPRHGRSRAARAPPPGAPRDGRRRAPADGRLDAALRAPAAQPDPQADRRRCRPTTRPGSRASARSRGSSGSRSPARSAGEQEQDGPAAAAQPRRGRARPAAPTGPSPAARAQRRGRAQPRGRRPAERLAVRRAAGAGARVWRGARREACGGPVVLSRRRGAGRSGPRARPGARTRPAARGRAGRAAPRRGTCRDRAASAQILPHRPDPPGARCTVGGRMRPAAPPGPTASPAPSLTGPWPVGQYAAALRDRLRGFARVQVFGEVFNLRPGRARVWFELRDERGALPCSMWRTDFDALAGAARATGSASSPRAAATTTRARAPRRRRSRSPSPTCGSPARATCSRSSTGCAARSHAEGLFEPQKRLPRAGAAALHRRRHRRGRQGARRRARRAAPARLGRAGRVGVRAGAGPPRRARRSPARSRTSRRARRSTSIIVARGGGSLADLFAFCDETLCRTVALLRVPVIASVGHHTDRTLIDDVAAVSCSTPTHAAEAAVPSTAAPRAARLHGLAARLERQGRRAIVERARTLARLSRAPADHVAPPPHAAAPARCASCARAPAAASPRERRTLADGAAVLERKAAAAAARPRARGDPRARRRRGARARPRRRARAPRARRSSGSALALAAHDPQRTLERGYALVEDAAGEPLTTVAEARSARAHGAPRSPTACCTVRRDDGCSVAAASPSLLRAP